MEKINYKINKYSTIWVCAQKNLPNNRENLELLRARNLKRVFTK